MEVEKEAEKKDKRTEKMRCWRYGLLVCLVVGLCLLLSGDSSTLEDFQTFIQTDWSGGASTLPASHPDNKTGWTKYSSTGTYVKTTEAGKTYLLPETLTLTDDTDTDFSGTADNVNIVGTGTAAKLQLALNITDPFASSLGEWLSLTRVPSMTGRPEGGWSVRHGDYIYAIWGQEDQRTFGRYSIANGTWDFSITPLPKPVAKG